MKRLLAPVFLIACLFVATSCESSIGDLSAAIRTTWEKITGNKVEAGTGSMTEQTDRLVAIFNNHEGDADERREEGLALVQSLNENYPVAPAIGRDSLLRIFKANPPARIGSLTFGKAVAVQHESDAKVEFIPPIRFGTSRSYSDVVLEYGNGATHALPIAIFDTGDFGFWARVRHRENLYKGILSSEQSEKLTYEKTITYKGQPWAILKRRDDGSTTFATMWNDRFQIFVGGPHVGFSDPGFFYTAVNLEWLNRLK